MSRIIYRLSLVLLVAAWVIPARAQFSPEGHPSSVRTSEKPDEVAPPAALWTPLWMLHEADHALQNMEQTHVASDAYTPRALACSINEACPEGDGWADAAGAVVLVNNCTGVLVNNTRADGKPYILTANHCGSPTVGDTVNWTVRFNYQSTTCADPSETPTYQALSGAVVRAAEGGSYDYTLLELLDPIPDSYNVSYAGWSIEDIAPSSGVVIGHPKQDIKKITFDDDPVLSYSIYWDATFDRGTVESGSSGAPLFNEAHQVIGLIRSAISIDHDACSGPGGDDNGARILFPRLAVNWSRGTPGARIADFLDPDGTGSTSMSSLKLTSTPSHAIWINEINANASTAQDDEYIELVGTAGASLNGYQLDVYTCAGGSASLQATHALSDFTFQDEDNGYGFFVAGGTALSELVRDQTFASTDVLPDGQGMLVLTNASDTEVFDYQYDTQTGGVPDQCGTGRTTRSDPDAPDSPSMGFTTNGTPESSTTGASGLQGSPGTANFDGGQELPVELTDFTATLDGRNVNLRWTTASETNNAGFEIEAKRRFPEEIQGISKKGVAEWEVYGFVEGQGTTLEAQPYAYRVRDLQPGVYRFRLKQLDYDGTYEYSPEVEVVVEMAERVLMEPAYPNPFSTHASVRFAIARAQPVEVSLYDMLGRRVRILYAGEPPVGHMQTLGIDGEHLPSGTYLVRLTGTDVVETQVVILRK